MLHLTLVRRGLSRSAPRLFQQGPALSLSREHLPSASIAPLTTFAAAADLTATAQNRAAMVQCRASRDTLGNAIWKDSCRLSLSRSALPKCTLWPTTPCSPPVATLPAAVPSRLNCTKYLGTLYCSSYQLALSAPESALHVSLATHSCMSDLTYTKTLSRFHPIPRWQDPIQHCWFR